MELPPLFSWGCCNKELLIRKAGSHVLSNFFCCILIHPPLSPELAFPIPKKKIGNYKCSPFLLHFWGASLYVLCLCFLLRLAILSSLNTWSRLISDAAAAAQTAQIANWVSGAENICIQRRWRRKWYSSPDTPPKLNTLWQVGKIFGSCFLAAPEAADSLGARLSQMYANQIVIFTHWQLLAREQIGLAAHTAWGKIARLAGCGAHAAK